MLRPLPLLQNEAKSVMASASGAAASIRPVGFMPQLDSLRAIAVAAVMLHHFNVSDVNFGPAAQAGVRLFLVLSGFLITGLLLGAREAAEAGNVRLRRAFGDFYARRALRILPVYYLVVVGLIAFDVGEARRLAPWLLSYLSNFGFIQIGYFPATFAHLWTLAVEQQFYLLWPLVVLCCPRRWLWQAALAGFLVAPLFRLVGAVLYWDGLATYIATPGCLDSLCAGALLAIIRRRAPPRGVARTLANAAMLGGAAVAVGLLLLPPSGWAVKLVLLEAAFSVAAAGLLWRAAEGFGGVTGRVLSQPSLLYLGKISYGLYVYHVLVRDALLGGAAAGPFEPVLKSWTGAALFTGITVAVAALSWRFFEAPLLKLKGRFAAPPP